VTTVRLGSAGDLGRVAEIKVRNWKDTYGPLIPANVLRPFLDPVAQLDYVRRSVESTDAILLVAEERTGNVIGFSLAFLDHGPEPWLESLHVHPDFQSRGAGTLLMRATATELKARGFNAMRLGVVDGNTAAERFYERLGGVDAGREPVSWATGVMHHIYRWPNLDALA
jgi:ribosomal protein S18 acetylase RimI-like enzyme